jgi:hypothetical protein
LNNLGAFNWYIFHPFMDELDVKKVQAEAKRKADLANRLLKEGAAKATIEAAKAIHESK